MQQYDYSGLSVLGLLGECLKDIQDQRLDKCFHADMIRQCIILLCGDCRRCLSLHAPCEGKCLAKKPEDGGIDLFTTHPVGSGKTHFMGRLQRLHGHRVLAHVTSQKEVDSYVTLEELMDSIAPEIW